MKNNFYFYFKQYLKIIEKNRELIKLISGIDQLRNSYIIQPQEIVNVPNDNNSRARVLSQLQNNIQKKNAQILQIIRSKRPNEVFRLTNTFLQDLNLFDSSYNDENDFIQLLKDFPEKHTDAYSEKESKYIFDIIELSSRINQTINDEISRANFIIEETIKTGKRAPVDYFPLRIGTDQDIPLVEDFITIFKSIEELYNFLCYLYKVDEKTKPLIINQISTGSWYSELLGIKQVVKSLENLLKGIGQFIRDYITGRIGREKFENECKKAEAFINLLIIAKENGIDNAELGIFKKLNPLVENFKNDTTTILEVNEEEILKLKKIEKLTLLEKKKKRERLLDKINLSIEDGQMGEEPKEPNT